MKKNNLYQLIAFGFITLCFLSCTSLGSKKATYYKLSIVITDKLAGDKNAKFPDDIINICKPMKYGDSGRFFMPKPVILHRVGKEYQKELSVLQHNATNLKSHENSVDAYFINGDGKSVGNELSADNPAGANQVDYLNTYLSTTGKKEKIFYFSQNAKNDTINKSKLYNNADSLKAAISTTLAGNASYSIVVVFNPIEQAAATPVTVKTDTTTTSSKLSTPVAASTPPTSAVPTAGSVSKPAVKGSPDPLEDNLHKLADPKISEAVKTGIKKDILSLFKSPNVEVIQVNDQRKTPTGITIAKYLESIEITRRIVTVVDKRIENEKIAEIYVSEK